MLFAKTTDLQRLLKLCQAGYFIINHSSIRLENSTIEFQPVNISTDYSTLIVFNTIVHSVYIFYLILMFTDSTFIVLSFTFFCADLPIGISLTGDQWRNTSSYLKQELNKSQITVPMWDKKNIFIIVSKKHKLMTWFLVLFFHFETDFNI